VVVAYNKIDATFAGIFYFINGFNTTIEGYYQFEILFGGVVNSFERNTISFAVPVGDIVVDMLEIIFFQEGIIPVWILLLRSRRRIRSLILTG